MGKIANNPDNENKGTENQISNQTKSNDKENVIQNSTAIAIVSLDTISTILNWTDGEFLFSNISTDANSGYVNISYTFSSYVFKPQLYYEGYWSNNTPNGRGKLFLDSILPESYEGGFKDGLKDGEGTYTDNDISYIGNYSKDMRDGFGTMTKWFGFFRPAETYEGYWKQGKKNGYGNWTLQNRDNYKGDFKNGLRDGKGMYTASNGSVYNGSWFEDRKTGEGRMWWPWGDSYEGGFKDDLIVGPGVYTWGDGSTFVGTFHKGYTSYGTLTNAEGTEVKDYTQREPLEIGIWKEYRVKGQGQTSQLSTILIWVLCVVVFKVLLIVSIILLDKRRKLKASQKENI